MRKSAYSPVLDRTVQSGPTIPKTGLDCGLGVPDCTVRSFLQSPFPSDKKTRLYGPVSLKPDRTAVWGCWTVRSGLFQRSTNKATVRTGPDRDQSNEMKLSRSAERRCSSERHNAKWMGLEISDGFYSIKVWFCNGVVVDERTLCSAVNNSVRQVGIR